MLVNEVGWRWTALVYAAAHLLVTAPTYALTIPRQPSEPTPGVEPARPSGQPHLPVAPRWPLVILVATVSTLGTSIATLMSVHMFTLLTGIGIAGTAAVLLAATIGPSQVGARFIELVIGRKHHPLWTMLAATLAMAVAISFLGIGILAPAILVIVYGAGIGLSSIANGTVPLALFGQDQYARLIGRIALPSLLAQAATPIIGSVLIRDLGHQKTLIVLGLVAFLAFVLAIWLMLLHRGKRKVADAAAAPQSSNLSAHPS